MRVAVLGAGISGLVAAYRLRQAGAQVTVYESSERIGGKLRTVELGDAELDLGAEAFLARRPEMLDLAEELGLEVVHPGPARAAIYAGGRAHEIPGGTVMGIPASAEAVRGIAELTGQDTGPVHVDERTTVGGLLRERLGDQVVDRLVDPLFSGVYAGRADALGLRATMPAFAEALEREGSVLSAAASLLPEKPSTAPVFGALRGGYAALLEALLAEVPVRTGATVHGMERLGGGWRLAIGARPSPEHAEVDAVVLAVPAPAAAKLLAEPVPEAGVAFGEIELASMAVLGFAYREEPPRRSGILIASGERHADGTPFTAKAVTFSGRKWPHLPDGMLRASVGRFGEEGLLRRGDAELVAAVRADLAELTGITAPPEHVLVRRWGGGLPQYGPGHVERVGRIERAIEAEPGLAVAGAALHGVGVPACIATAEAAVRRVLAVG